MRLPAAFLKPRLAGLIVVWLAVMMLASCSQSGSGPIARSNGGESEGAAIYQANCAACHGPNGEGEPDWKTPKEDGTYPAPPHTADGHTWHHGDGLLFQIIKGGGDSLDIPNFKSNMPAFGETLSDEEIVTVLDYLKSLWPEEQRQIQAEVSGEDPLPLP